MLTDKKEQKILRLIQALMWLVGEEGGGKWVNDKCKNGLQTKILWISNALNVSSPSRRIVWRLKCWTLRAEVLHGNRPSKFWRFQVRARPEIVRLGEVSNNLDDKQFDHSETLLEPFWYPQLSILYPHYTFFGLDKLGSSISGSIQFSLLPQLLQK